MKDSKYIPVIGLEVHVELKTNSKMFCGCSANYFGKEPNTHCCPICLGLPGALPVPNKKAIEWCVMIGFALNCEIPLFSKFDRKNYFYPDLPKGYQISQYDNPFCINGHITLSNGKKIGIRRVHMEEDTAKLTHATVNDEKVSLIDFNRSGVPLVEIVTEPDFESAEEVSEYLKKLQQIVRYLGVSNADMEKGDMRLEPNISLRKEEAKELPSYKVEVKNINSFRFVDRAIEYEIARQTSLLEKGETPRQETRGFSEEKNATLPQRGKEEAHDYRYFPEPDIPPIRWKSNELLELRAQMSELPDEMFIRIKKNYRLPDEKIERLIQMNKIQLFEETKRISKQKGNTEIMSVKIADTLINKRFPADVKGQDIYNQMISLWKPDIEGEELEKIVKDVLEKNKKATQDYKKGKIEVLEFLKGEVRKRANANIHLIREVILKEIEKP